MKIYISLPISNQDRQKAMEKADLISAKLSKEGHTPVNPFYINAGKNPSYEDYICYDLRAMLDCDAIIFCKGAEHSCDCCIEYDVAKRFIESGRKNFKIMFEK